MTNEKILLKRGYLLSQSEVDENAVYYAAKLLADFGVVVDKPNKTTKNHLKTVSGFYDKVIPNSFYSNPQDLVNYSVEELYLEQLVSYFRVECVDGIYSDDPETFKRIELFKKAQTNYEEGEEIVLRNYMIIDPLESIKILNEIGKDLASYTRAWSEEETQEFETLYEAKIIAENVFLKSKDNAIHMFQKTLDGQFAKSLDQKDVVKLSVDMIGEVKRLSFTKEQEVLLKLALRNCRKTNMSKKQAKMYNQLKKKLLGEDKTESNAKSPYRIARKLISEDKVYEAAVEFSKYGSLLERNLVWLLSRAKINDISRILSLIEANNPIVLYQLLESLTTNVGNTAPRTFLYYYNKKVRKYVETADEVRKRKSRLSLGIVNEVEKVLLDKIKDFYRNLPKLGKVYVGEGFNKIAVPLNTSASGGGLDLLPAGSRVPLTEDHIRIFTYWEKIYDVDASVIFINDKQGSDNIGYWNYSSKPFGDDVLHSGDDRSNSGSEFIDIKIDELVKRGYKMAVFNLNGFSDRFSRGECFAGYQNKKDLNTTAWKPNNISLKIKITADSNYFTPFAIDLETKEIIIINEAIHSNRRTFDPKDATYEKYINSKMLSIFNVRDIIELRATEIVSDPKEADIVYDRDYVTPIDLEKEQKVVRPNHIEAFVALNK